MFLNKEKRLLRRRFRKHPTLKHLSPVPYEGITIYVASDYAWKDGIRMPMGFHEAEELAERLGMELPTVGMVDAIWQAAEIKLNPIFMTPDDSMVTVEVFREHNARIEEQLHDFDYKPGMLIAGHKKDIVVPRKAGRVAIYGWHQQNGKPVQPYSNVHHEDYKDYSHGVRLVYPIGFTENGTEVNILWITDQLFR